MNARSSVLLCTLLLSACSLLGPKTARPDGLVRTEHVLEAPAGPSGAPVRVSLREVAPPGPAPRAVVLFIAGAGMPADVAFDFAHGDASWMGHLAGAGYDTFALDATGDGPAAPAIAAAVDHLLRLRQVDQVDLVAWAQGAPRALAFALRQPGKVGKLVLLAPADGRDAASDAPSKQAFLAAWDRQLGCMGQVEPAARDAAWASLQAAARKGTGPASMTAPSLDRAALATLRTPVLLILGEHDKQVAPARVRQLYDEAGAPRKVLVDLACASHNAPWESNHRILFDASLQWLRSATVLGRQDGVVRIGG